MSIRSRKTRQITSYLAMVASLLVCLQQCHAYCYLTSCDVASGEVATCECGDCCRHEHDCHHHGPADTDDSHDDHSFGGHHQGPCQSGCWCCRAADPLTVSSDTTDVAKKLLASSDLITCDLIASNLPDHALAAAFDVAYREYNSLSAAELCVQLCRFRI